MCVRKGWTYVSSIWRIFSVPTAAVLLHNHVLILSPHFYRPVAIRKLHKGPPKLEQRTAS